MKLLHTGDLHLGKSFYETSLVVDQRIMLDQLLAELKRDDYSALLIAGDIYDRTIPPAEAVEIFGNFLVEVKKNFPLLTICFIPGNHDSAQRLGFASKILGSQGIHIVSNPEDAFTPVIITGKSEEQLAIFMLPFLSAGSLTPKDKTTVKQELKKDSLQNTSTGEFDFDSEIPFINETTDVTEISGQEEKQIPVLLTQAELAEEASRRFSKILSTPELSNIATVLLAHLFTYGGESSSSERTFLGTAEHISSSLFSQFSYVALGHLHKPQKVTQRMYYSGSPLAYSFDEASNEKSFLKVSIDCKTEGFPVTVTPIPIIPFRSVVRLRGAFSDFYIGESYDAYSPDYIEITLTDEGLVANPMNLLRPKFPWLLSLRQGFRTDNAEFGAVQKRNSPEQTDVAQGDQDNSKPRNLTEDFDQFQIMLRGELDTEKRALFNKFLAECTDET